MPLISGHPAVAAFALSYSLTRACEMAALIHIGHRPNTCAAGFGPGCQWPFSGGRTPQQQRGGCLEKAGSLRKLQRVAGFCCMAMGMRQGPGWPFAPDWSASASAEEFAGWPGCGRGSRRGRGHAQQIWADRVSGGDCRFAALPVRRFAGMGGGRCLGRLRVFGPRFAIAGERVQHRQGLRPRQLAPRSPAFASCLHRESGNRQSGR